MSMDANNQCIESPFVTIFQICEEVHHYLSRKETKTASELTGDCNLRFNKCYIFFLNEKNQKHILVKDHMFLTLQ